MDFKKFDNPIISECLHSWNITFSKNNLNNSIILKFYHDMIQLWFDSDTSINDKQNVEIIIFNYISDDINVINNDICLNSKINSFFVEYSKKYTELVYDNFNSEKNVNVIHQIENTSLIFIEFNEEIYSSIFLEHLVKWSGIYCYQFYKDKNYLVLSNWKNTTTDIRKLKSLTHMFYHGFEKTYIVSGKNIYKSLNYDNRSSKRIKPIFPRLKSLKKYECFKVEDDVNIDMINNSLDYVLNTFEKTLPCFFKTAINEIHFNLQHSYDWCEDEFYYGATADFKESVITLYNYPMKYCNDNNTLQYLKQLFFHEFGHFYYWYNSIYFGEENDFLDFVSENKWFLEKYKDKAYYFQYEASNHYLKNKISHFKLEYEYFCDTFSLYFMGLLDKKDSKWFYETYLNLSK